jgi:hypothetical protein
MKKIVPLLIGMLFLLMSKPVNAQIFKKLINSVKQNAQNKAGNKADSTLVNNGSSGYDSSATNKVLGSFAKAAQQNPNDTSAADLTMKGLGILTGQGGVSPADSASAIKSFMTASGGTGMMYESVTTITSKMGNSNDTAVTYFTSSGSARSEMRLPIPGASTNKMIVIAHAQNPKYSISLYPESKSYSLNIIDTALINAGQKTQVRKIGPERVNGYECIHAKLTTVSGSGMFKSTTTFDVWTSTTVPGYDMYKKLVTVQGMQIQMLQSLDKAGCAGYIVKMQTAAKDYSMKMMVIKAEKKDLPASMFQIPPGYAKSDGNMISHMVKK